MYPFISQKLRLLLISFALFLCPSYADDSQLVAQIRQQILNQDNLMTMQANNETFLSQAIYSEDIEAIQLLAANGVDMNADDSLSLAVFFGKLNSLNALVALGADINAREEDGATLLHTTVVSKLNRDNKTQIIQRLLELGLDINAVDDAGETALHAAVNDSIETINTLLAAGADINAKATLGNTPLIDAAYFGLPNNLMMINTLINAGADINYRSDYMVSALSAAAQANHVEVVKHLLKTEANPTLCTSNCDNTTANAQYAMANAWLADNLDIMLNLANADLAIVNGLANNYRDFKKRQTELTAELNQFRSDHAAEPLNLANSSFIKNTEAELARYRELAANYELFKNAYRAQSAEHAKRWDDMITEPSW